MNTLDDESYRSFPCRHNLYYNHSCLTEYMHHSTTLLSQMIFRLNQWLTIVFLEYCLLLAWDNCNNSLCRVFQCKLPITLIPSHPTSHDDSKQTQWQAYVRITLTGSTAENVLSDPLNLTNPIHQGQLECTFADSSWRSSTVLDQHIHHWFSCSFATHKVRIHLIHPPLPPLEQCFVSNDDLFYYHDGLRSHKLDIDDTAIDYGIDLILLWHCSSRCLNHIFFAVLFIFCWHWSLKSQIYFQSTFWIMFLFFFFSFSIVLPALFCWCLKEIFFFSLFFFFFFYLASSCFYPCCVCVKSYYSSACSLLCSVILGFR
jgi:hypothetical protein